ncbi:uncharacterized protein EAE98_012453 [Botrytis deweyae]|uniref:AB hydrolase-1 domain-containing protein n=1 Tax=Botrytis deweyae TaxID=2478750 RepID=A0ABQ7I2Z5_9HELO|nr:uncharacterized protein EAE98_012453 [Botrytis deweyae]KAF7908794.1 hypothetical protein EAE98_012453 [Botrytis deweyae]
MAQPSTLQYTPLSDRAQKVVESFMPVGDQVDKRVKELSFVKPRNPDKEGDTEVLDGVTFTHHFALGPADGDVIRWHYVEAGPINAEVIVFLHGIPDAWFQWHHQMAALSKTHRVIAPDLKGYGQSAKTPGDCTHEGAGEQLFAFLQVIGVKRFNLVTHDRGTVQGDFIVANHPEAIIRYGRGEQHLYHFNPQNAPQGDVFMDAPYSGIMKDPVRFVTWVHSFVGGKELPENEFVRIIQEYSYEGISKAVPRYFNSSSFRAEWLQRRNRLLNAWKCPVLVMQGYDSKSQPREFYVDAKKYIPNAKKVEVTFLPGGHFWPLESPEETTAAVRQLLMM